jgi:SAM-dependent methyltransferase
MDRLENVACNLCGSRKQTLAYEMPDMLFYPNELFSVVECTDCGLGFVNPRPTVEEISKYYPAAYFQPHAPKGFESYLAKRLSREARYLDPVSSATPPRTLLDLGCANGEFPRFMAARGWRVEGVETSDTSHRISDFPVYTQEFQNIPVHQPSYDAVTAWAVLEHVHDPMAYFRKASLVLKQGGLLVFVVTNFHSFSSRHLFCEDIPRHLYFYTRETVQQYLQKTGFTLLREENGRGVYKMAPKNWFLYILRTKLLGKSFTYKDVPMTSREFRKARNLKPGLVAALKYAAYSPTSTIDRMLWPMIEAVQITRKAYGISVYVARKS